MEKMTNEQFNTNLKSVMNALCSSIEKERAETDCYKNLFKDTDGVCFEGMLRTLQHQMMGPILTAAQVIKDKTGINVNSDTFVFLMLVPYMEREIEKYIKARDGFCCSVDKVYFHMNHLLKDTMKESR